MAQPAHPQPQEDFPFLLFRTIPTTTAATTTARTALIIIVPKLPMIHAIIENLLFPGADRQVLAVLSFTFLVNLVASL